MDKSPDRTPITSTSSTEGHRSAVLFIDDNPTEADQYKRLLERSGKLHVELGQVEARVADYAHVLTDSGIGAVILDQQLGEFSGVSHVGLEVADYLRSLSAELPVFILTNYNSHDLEEEGGSVDLIMDKAGVRNSGDVYVARILRRMGQYREALGERQAQLRELIDGQLAGTLSDAEEGLLASLRADIERPSDVSVDAYLHARGVSPKAS